MRILITCDKYPGNLSDGLTLRVFHYVRYLKAHHTFDLVCLDDVDDIEYGSDDLFNSITRVPRAEQVADRGLIDRLLDAINPYSLYPRHPGAAECISRQLESVSYDLIWDAGCNMLANLASAKKSGLPLLADQVDDSFLGIRREFNKTNTLYSKIWLAKQYILLWLFYLHYLANAECVLFVSETDARSFKCHFPWSKCTVIENGVDEEYFSEKKIGNFYPATSPHEIVFEGSMAFHPNIDAALYFTKEILPVIKASLPDARLLLVGRSPAPCILALQSASIEVTGTVEDVRPYLSQERVFVCPMRTGAGIKNKILQAWSMSMAIVSTSAGSGSLSAVDGQDILIRDDPQKFAKAVVTLFQDKDQIVKLGQAGRTRILRQYTWKDKSTELINLMHSISNMSKK